MDQKERTNLLGPCLLHARRVCETARTVRTNPATTHLSDVSDTRGGATQRRSGGTPSNGHRY
jgi:hypothetical protein